MSAKYYLGIDMGGTNIKIAIVNNKGSIVEESVIATDINAKPETIVKSIVEKASVLKNYRNTKTAGVGIAGDVDCLKGIVRFSPNLPKWKKINLKEMLEKLTKKKVFVDNDANTAAIGAFCLDVMEKSSNLVCVTLGTGVGGGIIINKKLYIGASCTAGEIGHITIDPKGLRCKCGNTGCIETFVGAKYLSAYAAKYFKENKSALMDKLIAKDYSKITPKILHAAAVKGDKVAKAVWNYAGEKLGILISDILNFINPDTIVLCGGISHAGKYLLDPLKKEIEKRAFKSSRKACKIIVSGYTNKLGVVGAAMLAKHSTAAKQ
ncbi:ROK family protein [Endomicrobium proavitum]|uniref:Putative Glucokinase n=1 Tax=Endomicrobium proavitum TaxID=1408281 RepID=A0A0G3WHK3_9BACT|nr:ROK family protein [Endomicrobium proavitum]AKL97808.1 putative Glucokinase [Endomicrobium proavitum]